jgi:hypothetical protein
MASIYKSCFNCGAYFLDEQASKNIFCKPECSINYVRCSVCGDYYEISDEHADPENYICSEDCMKKYKIQIKTDKYDLDFSKLK